MILVTGATGFVGEHLVSQLLETGATIRVLCRNTARLGQHGILSPAAISALEIVQGDVTDYFSIEQALNGIETIFHCAAFISYDPREREAMFAVNIRGTANVVNAALHLDVKRLVHVSSIAALGQAAEPGLLIDEQASWKTDKNNSNYAISKFYSEMEVWRGMEEGLEVIVVNPSVILGPGKVESGSNQLFRKVYEGLRFYSPGATGFVDVRDVAKAMIMLHQQQLTGKRFILNAHNLSYKKLFDGMAAVFNKKPVRWRARKWMGSLAWRTNAFWSKIIGKRIFISRETMRSAFAHKKFGGTAICEVLPQFSYHPLQSTLAEGAASTLQSANNQLPKP
ncbi:MAG: SDR family NAD(P)-dependent oxidoreductase [Bacteroidia bacterium]